MAPQVLAGCGYLTGESYYGKVCKRLKRSPENSYLLTWSAVWLIMFGGSNPPLPIKNKSCI